MMTEQRLSSGQAIPPIFLHDETFRQDCPIIAGIDEAGRGPLAGPVVAGAVVLPGGCVIEGLKDSKKTTERDRKRLFWEICSSALAVGVGIVDAETIDRINILQSTRHAMQHACEDLALDPDMLLIDAVTLPDSGVRQKSIIRGESVSASIAAASIIAKVVRDEVMCGYHEQYPLYNFKKHKGYATKEHMERIERHGPCPIHRKTFRRVADVKLPMKG